MLAMRLCNRIIEIKSVFLLFLDSFTFDVFLNLKEILCDYFPYYLSLVL